MTAPTTPAPFLTIERGNPDDTEVAALTMVFASLAAAAQKARREESERNMWGDPAEALGRPVLFNPNAFRNVTFY